MLIASFGSFIGLKLKIPMGAIIGAMVFIGLGKSFSVIQFDTSNPVSFVVQIALGIMIGLSFTRLTKQQIKQMRDSLVFVVISILVMTVITGLIVGIFTSVSMSVSFLSSAPGGMVEMATMASALKLDAPSVVFLHFSRLLIVMLVYPYIISYVSRMISKDELIIKKPLENNEKRPQLNKTQKSSIKYLFIIIAGLLGGLIGFLTGFPIGALIGCLISIIILHFIIDDLPKLPIVVKRCIQTFIGANIGLSFTSETFLLLPKLIIPGLFITLLTILFSLSLAYLLTKILKIDTLTAVCSLAPAGMSEMVMIAESYHVNIPIVITIHLFRIITIISLVPMIVYHLT
ncbi:AbrB family transcriptional regulator [Oceanobacillus jeddahense]|uniref:AbrB family transcriptional regulator n=1 Tax=Oceanobacillus jeddahense TaxID=1462527 RepID=A0ABY5K0R4_9BACI|nr:AbrB family transcriptional regulator [Oceanobacillus jeddahense]UUI05635.1 AbrB family transcriptional regulator [Oceanobacillus jeddahense]